MKVYFIGPSSSGKTTLARYLSKKLNIPLLPEVARTVLAERELNIDILRTNLDEVNSYQEEIFFRQIKEEEKLKDFVSDRSFDNLAYACAYATNFKDLFNSEECDKYIKSIKSGIENGDTKVFFVRPFKSILKNDGVRETVSWDASITIDAMIKMLVQLFDVKYINISTDSMQERVQLLHTIFNI